MFYKDEEKINLTSLELKLLSLLFMNLNKVVSRNTIYFTPIPFCTKL